MNPGEFLERNKECRTCRHMLPPSKFRSIQANVCIDCADANREKHNNRPRVDIGSVARQRARKRAMERLAKAFKDEFQTLFDEELEKARTEALQLATVVPKTDAHPGIAVPLKAGQRKAGETAADRIRDDVGRCPLCINRHDRGHVCPACGNRPQIVGPVKTPPPHQFRVDQVVSV